MQTQQELRWGLHTKTETSQTDKFQILEGVHWGERERDRARISNLKTLEQGPVLRTLASRRKLSRQLWRALVVSLPEGWTCMDEEKI